MACQHVQWLFCGRIAAGGCPEWPLAEQEPVYAAVLSWVWAFCLGRCSHVPAPCVRQWFVAHALDV
jgi:hypothetical protein